MTTPFSLTLSGELGLRGIEALKAEIAAALAGNDIVAIDTAGVEGADTSAIQLLLSAQKTANADGKTMSLTATEAGPLAGVLVALGLVAPDGAPLVPETSTWTIKAAA
jgi:ABC-type transporter Mla MlaB component